DVEPSASTSGSRSCCRPRTTARSGKHYFLPPPNASWAPSPASSRPQPRDPAGEASTLHPHPCQHSNPHDLTRRIPRSEPQLARCASRCPHRVISPNPRFPHIRSLHTVRLLLRARHVGATHGAIRPDDAVAEARQARQPGLERNRRGMIPDTRAILGRRRWAVRDRLSGGLSPVGLGAPRAEPGPRRGGVGAGTPASSFPRFPTSEVYIMYIMRSCRGRG